MNTKTILKNCIYVVAGSVIAVGLSYVVHAAAFVAPSGTPPAGNTAFPINVGTTNQVKSGGLSVLGFIANQNAELDGNSYFAGTWHADPAGTTPTTITFGGTDPKNIVRTVALALTGGFGNTGSIASTPLANKNLTPVCSDGSGSVILCTALDMCSNISGVQTTVPQGYVANSDGTCSVAPKRFSSLLSSDQSVEYFTNNVVNSQLTFHTPNHTASQAPLVAILSLDDDYPYGWIADDFGTEVRSTSFGPQNIVDLNQADSYSTLYSPAEAGTYNFQISSQGKIGIKGKFGGDGNTIGADFYMRIHNASGDQWIHLDPNPPEAVNAGSQLHEPYPIAGKTSFDFGAISTDTSTPIFFGITIGATGDQYTYVPYNFTFQQNGITLNQGDQVNVYAFIYGKSTTGDTSADTGVINALGGTFHNSPNNFFYDFSSPYQGTSISFTKTS